MNRRGFLARASAIVGVIAASCAPKMIGLAQAEELPHEVEALDELPKIEFPVSRRKTARIYSRKTARIYSDQYLWKGYCERDVSQARMTFGEWIEHKAREVTLRTGWETRVDRARIYATRPE